MRSLCRACGATLRRRTCENPLCSGRPHNDPESGQDASLVRNPERRASRLRTQLLSVVIVTGFTLCVFRVAVYWYTGGQEQGVPNLDRYQSALAGFKWSLTGAGVSVIVLGAGLILILASKPKDRDKALSAVLTSLGLAIVAAMGGSLIAYAWLVF